MHKITRREWIARMAAAGALTLSGQSRSFAAESRDARNPAAGARPKVLLYSGWAATNIGDIGHTPGTLRYLEDYFPEALVSCLVRNNTPAIMAMLRKRFPAVAFIEAGRFGRDGRATTPELQKAFDEADLFIINSGMMFSRFWKPPLGLLNACIASGKPWGHYGQTFDGFYPGDAAALPGFYSRAAFIFCRDTESLGFLRRENVTPKVLEFGPDGCFGIDVRDDAKAEAFMRENGLEPRKFITVTIRTDIRGGSRPGGEDEFPGLPGGAAFWSERLREVIVDWVRKTGLRVVIVPEAEKEIGPGKALVFDPLPADVRAHVVHRGTFWNADEAVSLYARARALVSMEPHSCIMGLAVGTPSIHFFTRRHGTKAWMFRDIGLSEWLIDIDAEPVARVNHALSRIHDDYNLAEMKVARAMRFVNDRSKEMMIEVRRAALASHRG